jgi:GDP-D-mannose dehydratase
LVEQALVVPDVFQTGVLVLVVGPLGINNITTQHLQNAVAAAHHINQNAIETANMTAKQAVKHADVAADAMWNPIQQGTADMVTSAGYTPNRAVDTATAGVGVAAEAVAATVAKQVDATVTPVLATLQQLIQALATATTSIANVVNQSQPQPKS